MTEMLSRGSAFSGRSGGVLTREDEREAGGREVRTVILSQTCRTGCWTRRGQGNGEVGQVRNVS